MRILPRVALLCLLAGTPLAAAETCADITQTPHELRIVNEFPADTPTVFVVGTPDTDCQPWRLTKGLTLNGVRLTERLLSESVLILRPDGTGQWGYWPGFDIFRLPSEKPPRETVEYGKYRFDPITKLSVGGGDMNHLFISQQHPVLYELAFPPAIRIRRIQIRFSCELYTKGTELQIAAFADRGCEDCLAETTFSSRPPSQKPVVLDGLDTPHAYFRIGVNGKGRAGLYRVLMEADLDTTRLELPPVPTGTSAWRVTDDEDSSHRARVLLRWRERPRAEQIWEDFEADAVFRGSGATVTAIKQPRAGFTGEGFLRVEFVADGKNRFLRWSLPKPVDLSEFNRLALATRQTRRGRPGPIRIGLREAGSTRFHYFRLPGNSRDWVLTKHDISALPRKQVAAIALYFAEQWGYWKKGRTLQYDVDTLCFWHEAETPSRKAEGLPDLVLDHQPRVTGPPLSAPRLKLEEWFPMGMYDGFGDPRRWDFMLDDVAALGMDAWYVSNGSLEKFEQILPKGEARGVRFIYQGTSAGALYYLHFSNAKTRQDMYQRQTVPRLRKWLPKLSSRYGFAALSLTEEIRAEISEELVPYYSLVRKLAPQLPPTVLHNNLQAAERDLELNQPGVITHDFYPFFWDPRSGPTTPRRSLSFLTRRLDGYYRVCRKHDASLWMMLQVHGDIQARSLDPPHYGYVSGYRPPTPAEIKLQAWVSVAHGATGIFYYTYVGRGHMTSFRDAQWRKTDRWDAARALFAELAKVGPLLCRLERDYGEKETLTVSNSRVMAHTFRSRTGWRSTGRYVVLANTDAFASQTCDIDLNKPAEVHDFIRDQHLTAPIRGYRLEPGDGTVLLLGSPDQFRSDQSLVAVEVSRWKGR